MAVVSFHGANGCEFYSINIFTFWCPAFEQITLLAKAHHSARFYFAGLQEKFDQR